MVKAIVEVSGKEIFYGTREAIYDLPLDTEKKKESFASDLIKVIYTINERLSDSMRGLYLHQSAKRERLELNPKKLISCLEIPQNIFLKKGSIDEILIVNFIAGFSSNNSERERIMEIKKFGIPNEVVTFDPSLLYEFGEKHGKLRMGDDFDISISNYKKFRNS